MQPKTPREAKIDIERLMKHARPETSAAAIVAGGTIWALDYRFNVGAVLIIYGLATGAGLLVRWLGRR